MNTKSVSTEPEGNAINTLLCLVLSDKGKNFEGKKLTEDNLNVNTMVKWRANFYKTGNRYKHLVELLDVDNKFIRTVSMAHICLVKNEA